MNRLKKIILTVLMIFTVSSCTGIGIGVGIPIGPVSVGVGTTLKVPQSKNKKNSKGNKRFRLWWFRLNIYVLYIKKINNWKNISKKEKNVFYFLKSIV